MTTTAIAKREDYTALDAEIGSSIDGEPLRFKDGRFIRGFDKTDVDLGTRFMMHPASTSDGFIKWEDGRPVDYKIRELNNPQQQPVTRESLGDLDKDDWDDGKDPWSYVMMIAMKDDNGVPLTFTTGTVGGKNAIKKALRDWRLARSKHADKVPVVELGVDSYEHRVHRTTVTFPVFRIVGWGNWESGEEASVKEVLNDDLPDWA